MNCRSIIAALATGIALAACSTPGSEPSGSASALALARVTTPLTHGSVGALQGYYLAKFTTLWANALPESFLCFDFTSSGSWSNTGSEAFSGTYLMSRKDLFASALWLPSPAVFLSLQGSVSANQGSGTFIVSGGNGDISGGGTFAMTGKQNKSCT